MLNSSDVREKSAGEIVTVADVAAEAALAAGLNAILPDSIVLGEEGADLDPSLLDAVESDEWVWLVDPLDGTHHFAAGDEQWGVMVALAKRGEVEAAWIHLPLANVSAWGRRHHGVFVDGAPVRVPPPPRVEHMRGALMTKFLPPGLKETVEAEMQLERTDSRHRCAAQWYVDFLRGDEHFALYYRTLPWDHAPGTFLAQEAGGAVHRFDGAPYRIRDAASGLLVAADEDTWRLLHDRLIPQVKVTVDL